jgi:YbbR domain-containing protein
MAKRDLVFHNFWWKLTSLLLAVIVWFVVHQDAPAGAAIMPRNTYRFSSHPLAVLRDSTDKRPVRITPTEVDVTVTAPITETTRLADADIQTFIDLSEVDGRVSKVRVRVYVPRGVRLEQITPDEATVEIME